RRVYVHFAIGSAIEVEVPGDLDLYAGVREGRRVELDGLLSPGKAAARHRLVVDRLDAQGVGLRKRLPRRHEYRERQGAQQKSCTTSDVASPDRYPPLRAQKRPLVKVYYGPTVHC